MSNAYIIIIIRFYLSSKNNMHSRRYLKDFSTLDSGILATIVNLRAIIVFNNEMLKYTWKWMIAT